MPIPKTRIPATHRLPSLQFGQENLAEICRETEPGSSEMTVMNQAYGLGGMFRQLASVPEHEPLGFAYEHVMPFDPDKVLACDLNDMLPVFLTSNPRHVEPLRQAGIERPIAAGFGIHYAQAALERTGTWPPPSSRQGTLAFPAKSTIGFNRSFDYAAYAAYLKNLPEEYQPVAVCIYWKDYLQGRHKAYLDAGIPVYSCGSFFDPLFFWRFIELCSLFRYSCSNSIASSYPLSVHCGCHFFESDMGEVMQIRDGAEGEPHATGFQSETHYGAQLRPLAPFPPRGQLLADQRKVTDEISGREHALAGSELLALHHESRDRLLKCQDASLSFREDVPHPVLNRWFRRHLFNDGWASSGMAFMPEDREGYATLELFFKISPKFTPDGQRLTISIDGEPAGVLACNKGFHRLRIPLAQCCRKMVSITAEHEGTSSSGSRRFALRLTGMRVITDASTSVESTPVERTKIPDELNVPDGW